MPDEKDDQGVEGGQQDQGDGVSEAVAVQLVTDERYQEDQRRRVCPELVSKQPDDQEDLHCPVEQQIDRAELLGRSRKTMDGMDQVIGDDVVRVLRQFVLGQKGDDLIQGLLADEKQQDPPDNLEDAIDSLQEDADSEELSKPFLCQHARSRLPGILAQSVKILHFPTSGWTSRTDTPILLQLPGLGAG